MIFNKNKLPIVSPAIMGICNVTKDSFSDGGKNYKTSDALKSIKMMIEEGAQIIDIGAESTKPGSDPINYKEEIRKKLISEKKQYSKSFMVSEIFFETSNSDQVENIYKNIVKTIENSGFDKAVLTYSSSNTASSGGNLGWIQEETLNENLKDIFFNMKEGEVTKPITVPSGFLVLKIEKIKKIKF